MLGDRSKAELAVTEIKRAAELLRDIPQLWAKSDVAAKRDIAHSLFSRIIVDTDKGQVVGVVPHPSLESLFKQCGGLCKDGDVYRLKCGLG